MVRAGRAERGIADASTKSTSTDMVTEFDRASERLIVDAISTERPHDTIVGEEGTDKVGTSGMSGSRCARAMPSMRILPPAAIGCTEMYDAMEASIWLPIICENTSEMAL